MFENVINFFKKIGRKDQIEEKSKDTAKERLHLVLMQDRANVSADFLDMMRQEIIEVIKKYIDVDENDIDVRLTNKTNEDGTMGAPALYANIPIAGMKEEMKKEKNIEKETKEENKKEEKKEEKKKEEKKEESKDGKIENSSEDKTADTENDANKNKKKEKANNKNKEQNGEVEQKDEVQETETNDEEETSEEKTKNSDEE